MQHRSINLKSSLFGTLKIAAQKNLSWRVKATFDQTFDKILVTDRSFTGDSYWFQYILKRRLDAYLEIKRPRENCPPPKNLSQYFSCCDCSVFMSRGHSCRLVIGRVEAVKRKGQTSFGHYLLGYLNKFGQSRTMTLSLAPQWHKGKSGTTKNRCRMVARFFWPPGGQL